MSKWEQLQMEILAGVLRAAAERGVSISEVMGSKCASALMLRRAMDLREIADLADRLGARIRISITCLPKRDA